MYNRLLILCLSLTLTVGGAALADTVKLKANHPDRYVVVKGDTLWDISGRFLQDPWHWPEIWQNNPEIKNPHLIYPGDVISLVIVNGKPALRLSRKQQGRPTVKLSPHAQFSSLSSAIPTIPLDAIKQFLLYPRIISKQELEQAGYIFAQDEGRLISGSGDKVYTRGMPTKLGQQFSIIRPGEAYRNPGADKDDILGYEALQIALGKVSGTGDPSTLLVKQAKREILIGDRLLPLKDEAKLDQYFLPHAPDLPVKGTIIAVLDGVSRIGQYHTVVLNKGKQAHLETGHVLAVDQTGEIARDTVEPQHGKTVRLPNERAGTIMVIRVFDRVSYALVMEARRDMRVYDTFTNP